MRWFWPKKKEMEVKTKKHFSMNLDIDGVQLVGGEYRTITRLERINVISVVMHYDREAKIQLYKDLTGIEIAEKNIHQFGNTLTAIERKLDDEIKQILEKKRLTIIFE